MDKLFFKTSNKNALLEELGIPSDFQGRIYESAENWALEWLGKLPAEMEIKKDAQGVEYESVKKWQTGEFFNIYLKGQDNMDFFTQSLVSGTQLIEPETPNSTLL